MHQFVNLLPVALVVDGILGPVGVGVVPNEVLLDEDDEGLADNPLGELDAADEVLQGRPAIFEKCVHHSLPEMLVSIFGKIFFFEQIGIQLVAPYRRDIAVDVADEKCAQFCCVLGGSQYSNVIVYVRV